MSHETDADVYRYGGALIRVTQERNAALAEVDRLTGELAEALADRKAYQRNWHAAADALAVGRARVRALTQVATGEVLHLFKGLCPDSLDGHDRRDPDCPACVALAGDTEGAGR